jgi:uncharacterized membrane protein YkvA (DUF1232 family)
MIKRKSLRRLKTLWLRDAGPRVSDAGGVAGSMSRLASLRKWARAVKLDVVALWIAARDPRVPWLGKIVAGVIAALALSPIDLIPDFIPVIGDVDDVIIVPLGILLAVRLVPEPLMREFRHEAIRRKRPTSHAGMIAIAAIWLATAVLLVRSMWPSGTG